MEDYKKTIYLAGPIFDCEKELITDWRILMTEQLEELGCKVLDPTRRMVFDEGLLDLQSIKDLIVNPDKRDIDESDIVLANCWKPSTGTAMEIFYAFENRKTVISMLMNKMVYNPWIKAHSTHCVGDGKGALHLIESILKEENA